MNKDRVEGKVKDATGRLERQAGEWTGDTETQAKGAARQVEGKIQNAWGKAKDATKDAAKDAREDSKSSGKPPQSVSGNSDDEDEESVNTRRSNG